MNNTTHCLTGSETLNTVFQAIYGLECSVIVVANSLALVIFLGKKLRLKKSKYLLVNLTVADLLTGLVGLGYTKVRQETFNSLVQPGQIQNVEIHPLLSVHLLFASQSMLSLSTIAMERAFAILSPFRHRQTEKKHYFTVILSAWLISMILSGLTMLFYLTSNQKPTLILNVVAILLEIGLIIISYFAIWIKRVFCKTMNSSENQFENKKLSITLFILIATSLVTWMPSTIFKTTLHRDVCIKNKSIHVISLSLDILLLSNSFLNVVVYSLRMPEFRKALRELFCRNKPNEFRSSKHQKEHGQEPKPAVIAFKTCAYVNEEVEAQN
ncbi:predicted protein [Nematostella vectensis]|uniref:G-protein coupled receptors family 1 profile domain-containing protein n=1 Tax=Nematostella vectensis TaxID=45351 RepID=A7RQT2_NEMVE|nr:tachykinin-like peptides receptor 86C [Nematostella vectensis]EDO46161.1 predicted protein [Nematostella vectensis]|eukprot:XP_001638224.1 predicted protein [Nematostella vectensis]